MSPAARFAAVLLLTAMSAPIAAEARRLVADWDELRPLIAGRTVSVVLPDGSVPRGEVLEIRPDSLLLGVKGRPLIQLDRSSVRVLMVGKRGSKWQILTSVLGAAAGFVSGMFIADAAFDDQWSAEGAGTSSGLAIIGAFGGYYLGYFLDSRSVTYITVRQRPLEQTQTK